MSCDKSWKMIERRVWGWIRKYDPNVVLLYRPKLTKRYVYPQVKYIALKRFLPFVASESVLQCFVNACTTELPRSAVAPALIREGDEVDEALYDTDYTLSTGLVFPLDCKRRKLVKYARKCDLTVTRRGLWYIVRDPDTSKRITVIPRNVRKNRRCRKIIKRLTARCEARYLAVK